MLAAAAGSGLGISGLLTYTAGLFGRSLGPAIGLSRTSFGLAFFLATLALAASLPIVGSMVDRFGARIPAAAGAAMLALGFLALGTIVHTVPAFFIVMSVIGVLAAASAPVAYTRAVSQAFDRSRGLALGLTQLGLGLAGMLVPPLLATVIERHGWERGYLALAAVALIGIVPALTLPSGRRTEPRTVADTSVEARSPIFRLQLAAFGLMALSFAGLITHFVPLLAEAGMSLTAAARVAALIGASVIFSRVLVGWLSDRVDATRIAAASCIVCAAGCVALAWGGPALAWIGAIALGATMGAEADLIGYLTARFYKLEAYGRLYAMQYASFILMAGLSPVWMGVVADRAGNYTPALAIGAGGLIVAAALFLRLPTTKLEPRARWKCRRLVAFFTT